MRIGQLEDLWKGDMQSVSAEGKRLLIVRHDDGVSAYADRCAHLGVPLSEGKLENGLLTCRAHGWCYDARTGRGVNPERARLVAFPVEVREGEIWVDPARG
ncbi:MAG TPA: Rieske 2Fe-2S domain-containing protein, partial [Polyangiales bacterium]|nr:Rieske 2Fe-2S domain-containing protein [Polyangiales bacterium]